MKNPIIRILSTLSLSLLASFALAEERWIDVRTIEEYQVDHIEGHANIPLATIQASGTLAGISKDDEIHLYCRSGRRAGEAMAILEAAGFTNVVNDGGIDDVRAMQSSASQH